MVNDLSKCKDEVKLIVSSDDPLENPTGRKKREYASHEGTMGRKRLMGTKFIITKFTQHFKPKLMQEVQHSINESVGNHSNRHKFNEFLSNTKNSRGTL